MNHVVLIGRTTADIELKTIPSGKNIANFCIAVKRAYSRDESDFINCIAFEKTAQTLSQYVKKGQLIAIEGRLQIRTYDANDGSKRKVAEVVIDRFEFCESKQAGNSATPSAGAYVPEQYTQPPVAPNFTEVADDEELPF